MEEKPAGAEGGEEGPAVDADASARETDRGPLTSSIALERTYRVNGRRVTVQAVLPSSVARVIGMEAAYEAARRIVLRVDSKEATIEEVPVGHSPPKQSKPSKAAKPSKGRRGQG